MTVDLSDLKPYLQVVDPSAGIQQGIENQMRQAQLNNVNQELQLKQQEFKSQQNAQKVKAYMDGRKPFYEKIVAQGNQQIIDQALAQDKQYLSGIVPDNPELYQGISYVAESKIWQNDHKIKDQKEANAYNLAHGGGFAVGDWVRTSQDQNGSNKAININDIKATAGQDSRVKESEINKNNAYAGKANRPPTGPQGNYSPKEHNLFNNTYKSVFDNTQDPDAARLAAHAAVQAYREEFGDPTETNKTPTTNGEQRIQISDPTETNKTPTANGEQRLRIKRGNATGMILRKDLQKTDTVLSEG